MNKRKKKVQVCVIAKSPEGPQVLLLKTNKNRGDFWQNVTGGVDKDEKYANAALREFQEETSYPHSLKNCELINLEIDFKFERNHKKIKEKVFALICPEVFEVTIDPKEHYKFKWMALESIKKKNLGFKTNFKSLKKCRNILL